MSFTCSSIPFFLWKIHALWCRFMGTKKSSVAGAWRWHHLDASVLTDYNYYCDKSPASNLSTYPPEDSNGFFPDQGKTRPFPGEALKPELACNPPEGELASLPHQMSMMSFAHSIFTLHVTYSNSSLSALCSHSALFTPASSSTALQCHIAAFKSYDCWNTLLPIPLFLYPQMWLHFMKYIMLLPLWLGLPEGMA